jgi:branched-chain amino acid transport system permease protein
MDRLLSFLSFVVIDGISYGMVLFLISVGLSVTMGLMRFANLAHGAFAAVGGAVAITLMTSAGLNFLLALVLAFVISALLGLVLEPILYAPLYGGDELDQVLMTIGLIFIVIASLNLIFGSTPLPMQLPEWLSASVDLGIAVGALLMVVLWLTLDRTEFGARIRAAVENPQMAQAVGIDTRRLFAVTFMLGCGLAGLGGALGAQMLPIDPVYPFRYLATFLIVVSIAGFGNIKGSAWVALMLGLIETTGRYLVPDIAAFLTYLILIAVLLWRPDGLFAKSR